MKIKWHKRILSALVLGSLALSIAAVSIAQAAPPHPGDPAQRLQATLSKLVEKKVIDAEQSHRVMLFFQQKDTERKAEWEKMKNMTPEERDAYMEQQCIQRCKKRPDLIKDLMEGAGLSQEQAKALAQEMRPPHGPSHGPGPDGQNPPPPAP